MIPQLAIVDIGGCHFDQFDQGGVFIAGYMGLIAMYRLAVSVFGPTSVFVILAGRRDDRRDHQRPLFHRNPLLVELLRDRLNRFSPSSSLGGDGTRLGRPALRPVPRHSDSTSSRPSTDKVEASPARPWRRTKLVSTG